MLVFNFHHVEPASLIQEEHQRERKMITITPEGLRQFIKTMRSLGFKFLSMEDVLLAYQHPNREALLNKSVLMTFDDGFVNNLTYGLPVLEAEGCPASIFVLPGRLSGNNAWDQSKIEINKRDQLVTEDQLKTLANSPYIHIGSHGLTHQHFTQLSDDELDQEINDSYQQLSQLLDKNFLPVIAYPWGEYDQRVIRAMKKSSYVLGFTTDKAPWDTNHENPYTIPRYSAYFRDGNPVVLTGKLLRHKLLF